MDKRNYGLDFLRMLSMFMVVMLHVLGQGGILGNAQGYNYWIAYFFEIASYCAVNAFALISGYVMWKSKTSVSKIAQLWMQVFFYGALISGIFFIIKPETISFNILLNILFPFTRKNYWYISSYFGMYLLVPLLNAAIKNTSKKTMGISLFSCFVFFSIIPSFLQKNPYSLSSGYSTIWLSLMYLTGAFINKYRIEEKTKKSTGWLLFAGSVFATWLSKIAIRYATLEIFGSVRYDNTFVNYTSPTIVLAAIGIFIACSKTTFSKFPQKLISICSPAALGVYLIHVQGFVWKHVIQGFSADFANKSTIVMVGLIFLSAIIIYTACTIIDLLRIQLFRLLRIKKLCLWIETFAKKVFYKMFGKYINETA